MKTYWWIPVVALLLSGCGELSYKRGASSQDLQAARKVCAEDRQQSSVEQCLESQGWAVKKLDDTDLFATAAVSPDNRNPNQFVIPAWVPVIPAASTATPTTAAPDSTIASTSAVTAPLAAPARHSGTVSDARSGSSTTAAPPTPVAPASSTILPAPAQPASPLDVYTISSWWKMGADREALAADTQACVSELGAAHKPNPVTQQVTRGFVVCMHDKGWKALRAVAS